MNPNKPTPNRATRFEFLRQGAVRLTALVLGLFGGMSLIGARRKNTVWQIDPMKCVQCERCATECVLSPSAVKCVQSYPICGYCQLCFGYFQPNAPQLTSAAENQLCPTGAIERRFVEDPYWEYNILEDACIGCAKCVKACEMFGNASFYLQVRHDRCLNCNDCSIARNCPSGAWDRVPSDQAYNLKHKPAPKNTAASRFLRLLLVLIALTLPVFFAQAAPDQEMRFPAPEFSSHYNFPETTVPPATSMTRQWIDVAVLAAALGLAAWLAVKRHSRRGVFWLMLFCLGYFGFYKQGCICPIGSIQNVTLSLFNSHYALPVTVLIFFGLPLLFALFFGRVFCSSVCALGAMQDIVAIKPVQLPRKVTVGLGIIPYVYLGLAVLLAATNTGFLICRYDPFVGFFRLSGNAPYLYLGAAFLIVGVFIARPYCRFFCRYGVLLGLMSRLSRWHLTITPSDCVNCRLCEKSCPYDYIHKPNLGLARENRQAGVHRLGYLFLMLPVLIALCGWIGHRLSVPLSRYNSTVAVAEQILGERQNTALESTLETRTFRSQDTTESELIRNALTIRSQLNFGGWFVGGFIGLVFGLKLIGFSTVRTRQDYEVDRTHCFSCARCCTYCPNDLGYRANFIPAPPATAPTLNPPTPAPEPAGRA